MRKRKSETESANRMAFWWPVLVLGFAFALCRFLLMLIPPNVPSIDVDTSDGTDLYPSLCICLLFFHIIFFRFLVFLLLFGCRETGGKGKKIRFDLMFLGCDFPFVGLPTKLRKTKENFK